MNVVECEQRTDTWRQHRAGRLTSSTASDFLAKGRGNEESKSRRSLRLKLALEAITGRCLERSFQSWQMAQGVEREAGAVGAYELSEGVLVRRVGFVEHDTLMAGGSPDGVIGDWVGITEFKCTEPPAHFDFARTLKAPECYERQALHLLWLTPAQWVDLVYWSPDFPPGLQLRKVRIHRDEEVLRWYQGKVVAFLRDVEKTARDIRALAEGVA